MNRFLGKMSSLLFVPRYLKYRSWIVYLLVFIASMLITFSDSLYALWTLLLLQVILTFTDEKSSE